MSDYHIEHLDAQTVRLTPIEPPKKSLRARLLTIAIVLAVLLPGAAWIAFQIATLLLDQK